jgi:hypothetical protein
MTEHTSRRPVATQLDSSRIPDSEATPFTRLVEAPGDNTVTNSGFRAIDLLAFQRATSAAFHPQLLEQAVAVEYPQLVTLNRLERLRFPREDSVEEVEASRLLEIYNSRQRILGRPLIATENLDAPSLESAAPHPHTAPPRRCAAYISTTRHRWYRERVALAKRRPRRFLRGDPLPPPSPPSSEGTPTPDDITCDSSGFHVYALQRFGRAVLPEGVAHRLY